MSTVAEFEMLLMPSLGFPRSQIVETLRHTPRPYLQHSPATHQSRGSLRGRNYTFLRLAASVSVQRRSSAVFQRIATLSALSVMGLSPGASTP